MSPGNRNPSEKRAAMKIFTRIGLCAFLFCGYSPPATAQDFRLSKDAAGRLSHPYFFGAHIYRVPSLDMDSVLADMATMKELGMNLVNIQETWAWDNPREDKYDFSNLKTLVEEARKLDLMASITVTMEVMPKWVWDAYPDCRLLNASNQPYEDPTQYVMPADGKPGPCWDHPGVQKEAERFLARIAEEMSAYENVVYWNVWQEAHLWYFKSGASPADKLVPYNPETLDHFRDFLREKYKTLDALNDGWKIRYGSWREVDPPRVSFSVPSYLDWSRFIHEEYIGNTLNWRRQALLKHDALKRPVGAHTATPYFGTTCEFHFSECLDFYGTSFYPTVSIFKGFEPSERLMDRDFSRYQELWGSLFHLSYSRCAAKTHTKTVRERQFLVSEMACGPYNDAFTVRGEVTAADLRRWLLLQLAAGSQGVILWNTRPEHFWNEAQGQGFLDAEGKPTERAEVIRSFAKATKKHQIRLVGAVNPITPVALFQDEALFRFAQGSGQAGIVVEAIRGCYRACFDAGIEADFMDGDREEPHSLSSYRVVIHPFPAVMSDETAQKLRSYVEQGGVLIAGPTPSRFDEHGFARLSFMSREAEQLFGVRHASIRQVAEFDGQKRWTPEPRRFGDLLPATRLTGIGMLEGLQPKAAMYIQTFQPTTAEPILRWNDEIVGTKNTVGEGTAYLFGTLFSHSILGENCKDFQTALERILFASRIPQRQDRDLFVCDRAHPFGPIVFVINKTGEKKTWTSPIAEDLLTEERFQAGDTVEIEPYDLRAFVIDTNLN